jgi:hypothetical protein
LHRFDPPAPGGGFTSGCGVAAYAGSGTEAGGYVRRLEALLLAEPANYKRQHTNWLAAIRRFGLQEA